MPANELITEEYRKISQKKQGEKDIVLGATARGNIAKKLEGCTNYGTFLVYVLASYEAMKAAGQCGVDDAGEEQLLAPTDSYAARCTCRYNKSLGVISIDPECKVYNHAETIATGW